MTLADLVDWQARVLDSHAQAQPVRWMPEDEAKRREMQDHATYVVATLYTREERQRRETTLETLVKVGQMALDEIRYWRKKMAETPALSGVIGKAPLMAWDVWVPHTDKEEVEALGLLWQMWRGMDGPGRSRMMHWMRYREQVIILKREGDRMRAMLRDELLRGPP